jgi:hypothetical protein
MVCIIDFDGTFLKNDFFKEVFFKKIIDNPFYIIKHFIFNRRGILELKIELLKNHQINYPIHFLINQDVSNWILENRQFYKKLLLVSASPDFFVKKVLSDFNFFDEIHGSSTINLKGTNKLNFIKERWQDFDYMGDSNDDLPIFKNCNNAFKITSKGIINAKK